MVAKKKTKKAKKKTVKKKKTTTRKVRTRTIRYSCTGAGFCKANPHVLTHVHLGDTVILKAVNTNVKLTFTTSPFKKKTFRILAGKQESALVVNGPATFRYTKTCDDCPNADLTPRIIVE